MNYSFNIQQKKKKERNNFDSTENYNNDKKRPKKKKQKNERSSCMRWVDWWMTLRVYNFIVHYTFGNRFVYLWSHADG